MTTKETKRIREKAERIRDRIRDEELYILETERLAAGPYADFLQIRPFMSVGYRAIMIYELNFAYWLKITSNHYLLEGNYEYREEDCLVIAPGIEQVELIAEIMIKWCMKDREELITPCFPDEHEFNISILDIPCDGIISIGFGISVIYTDNNGRFFTQMHLDSSEEIILMDKFIPEYTPVIRRIGKSGSIYYRHNSPPLKPQSRLIITQS